MTDGVEVGHKREIEAFDRKLYERPYPTCGRPRKKQPGLCTRPAGWATVHPGRGACKLHGGIKSTERDKRLKSGMYSGVRNVRVQEIHDELSQLEGKLDVTQDLTLARAVLVDLVERHGDLVDAILAWNATRRDEERPAKVPDLAQVIPAIEAISRIVYRIEKASSDKYIPRGTFYRVMMAMGRSVDSRVHDEAVREQIRQDWLRIEAV